jgi:hypothetical protein
MRSLLVLTLAVFAGPALSACAVISVVDTAVGVTATAVSTTVDVAAGAVDVIAGSSDDDKPDCEDEDKDKDVCKDKKPD